MNDTKLKTPLYLEVITVGNNNLVCRLTNGCDHVPMVVRRAFAELLMDAHVQHRGTLGGAGKMYGTSYFPGTHRYDYITPGGLKSDTDYWFYELSGSLKCDLTVGSTISFVLRDGDYETVLDSDSALAAIATAEHKSPMRVVAFKYYDSALERLQIN